MEKEYEMNLAAKRDEEAQLQEKITSSVVEAVERNMREMKDEMMRKTIEEVKRTITLSLNGEKPVPVKNGSVHNGYTCDGCQTYPIVGVRYKCLVCRDFDFCESCEAMFGDDHKHPLIKHREELKRPFHGHWRRWREGGCRRWKNEEQVENKVEEKTQTEEVSKEKPKIVQFFENTVDKVKNFFQGRDSAEEIVIEPKIIRIEPEQEIVIEKKEEHLKEENVEEPKNAVSVISQEEKNFYIPLLMDLRDKFFFGDLSNDDILTALVKTKGNLDEALVLLFP
jgi:hypothetical protein